MRVVDRTLFPVLKKALEDRRITVITGIRGVGKTTTLKWLLDQVASINKAYIDLGRVDQRAVFEQPNVEEVVAYLCNLGLTLEQPLTLALDEVQTSPQALGTIKTLSDRFEIKFILASSTLYSLRNEVDGSLTGRKVVFELRPLGFGEFLDFQGIPYQRQEDLAEMRFDCTEHNRLKNHYDEYLTFGGLPTVVMEPRPEVKREILNDIFSSYINLDVASLADFRKLNELKLLLQVLPMRIGNKLDLSKLSAVVGISRPTLNGYLEFLEKTYVISQLPAFAGPDKALAHGRKLYFCDNGIASILSNPGEGALFENAVFNQLRNYGVDSYYSKSNEAEIDFILAPPKSPPAALEVKYHPVQRDLQRLHRLAQQVEISQAWIVGKYPTPGFENFIWGGSIF